MSQRGQRFPTADFISEIRYRPCLYDKSLPNYKDTLLKRALWAEIGDKFGITGKSSQNFQLIWHKDPFFSHTTRTCVCADITFRFAKNRNVAGSGRSVQLFHAISCFRGLNFVYIVSVAPLASPKQDTV